MYGTLQLGLLKCDARKDTAGAVDFFECRAWCTFDTNAASVVIISGGNVGSITDGGTGVYTVNFTNAFTDALYTVGGFVSSGDRVAYAVSKLAGSYQINIRNAGGSLLDAGVIGFDFTR